MQQDEDGCEVREISLTKGFVSDTVSEGMQAIVSILT